MSNSTAETVVVPMSMPTPHSGRVSFWPVTSKTVKIPFCSSPRTRTAKALSRRAFGRRRMAYHGRRTASMPSCASSARVRRSLSGMVSSSVGSSS